MKPEKLSYEVEEVNGSGRRYTVWLETVGSGVKAECNCHEYLCYGKWCDHVTKAITCYELGLQ